MAAGSGSRFGGDKLQAMLHDKPLILHSASTLAVCDRVIAIVRTEDLAIREILDKAGIDWVENPYADQGMGTSIATGVNASEDSDGWLILPGDMPCVATSITQSCIRLMKSGADIVAPAFNGQKGHPVGFSWRFVIDLQRLNGDQGARSIISAHPQSLCQFDVDSDGILMDVDTRYALNKFHNVK